MSGDHDETDFYHKNCDNVAFISHYNPLKYCPFCGQKLEEGRA